MAEKPNILIIWGDDIGISNLSTYSDGLMGYRTPNIDRIADEGVKFTDYYGEQSCTAGRAAFITGQNPYRTGLTKVGMPGRSWDCSPKTPRSPTRSSTTATRRDSSARTTSVTATSTCRRRTASTSSSATCITSTPRKSRSTPTTRRMRSSPASVSGSVRAASSIPGRTATAPSASRTPAP